MFYVAYAFNQDLTPWNIDAVTDFSYMFSNALAFSQTLGWNLPAGASVFGMFELSSGSIAASMAYSMMSQSGSYYSYSQSASYSIEYSTADSNFQVACDAWVSDSSAATATYGDIAGWDTSAVMDMSNAFKNAASFNDDISLWNTSSVTNMRDVSNERIFAV
jgi:surface protein